ncbi:aromatic acid exporter family protein [Streptomyces sp. NPDC002886]|uniref:FUSC family protein n=1 Tax=Streptomyces sp. NPDC002886 TaxID=3364667 RepID=UPI0036ABA5FD
MPMRLSAPGGIPGRAKAAAARAVAFVRRAVGTPGSERDTLLLGAKTVVAAMVAWTAARHFLPPAVATFAPYTAMVALQATVYRSLRDCAQYALAMAVGAALAAALAATAGIHGWTFGLLTLVALCLGRARRLGRQGAQVAIVGFFAFSSGQGRIDYIGHLAASVAIGAVCGLTAHLLLAPARHARHRQTAATDLYAELSERMTGLADTFEATAPDADRVRQWRQDWRRLSRDCEDLHRSIETEEENGLLNPRRSFEGAAGALPRTRASVKIAQRALDHLRSITRTLDHAVESREIDDLPPAFRTGLAAVLRTSADAMDEMGRTPRTDDSRLDRTIEEASARLDEVHRDSQSRPEARSAAPTLQGTLLTDAARLLVDLRTGRQDLSNA